MASCSLLLVLIGFGGDRICSNVQLCYGLQKQTFVFTYNCFKEHLCCLYCALDIFFWVLYVHEQLSAFINSIIKSLMFNCSANWGKFNRNATCSQLENYKQLVWVFCCYCCCCCYFGCNFLNRTFVAETEKTQMGGCTPQMSSNVVLV